MVEKTEKKKNPVWDKLFADDRLSGTINPDLPEFLKIAIEHERGVVKLRLKQVESYLDRITHLQAGMDYFDTFKVIKPVIGYQFPKEKYMQKKAEWEKEKKRKK